MRALEFRKSHPKLSANGSQHEHLDGALIIAQTAMGLFAYSCRGFTVEDCVLLNVPPLFSALVLPPLYSAPTHIVSLIPPHCLLVLHVVAHPQTGTRTLVVLALMDHWN